MGFNSYAAGNKHYGGGRSAPNIGPVDPLGYKDRDAGTAVSDPIVMRNAALRKLMALKNGDYASANAKRVMGG